MHWKALWWTIVLTIVGESALVGWAWYCWAWAPW